MPAMYSENVLDLVYDRFQRTEPHSPHCLISLENLGLNQSHQDLDIGLNPLRDSNTLSRFTNPS